MSALEKARLWTWAHRELGDDACAEIQRICEERIEGACICGDVLATLLVLP